MQKIESGKVVALSLSIQDVASGKVLEEYPIHAATLYLHGVESFPEALENGLEGLEEGADFDFTVDDAYGPALVGAPHEVPKREFPKNWPLRVGFGFVAGGTEGKQATLYVHGVKGSRVLVAGEHPWGGKAIRYSGKILGMRNATMEERQHGHAHGPGGHAH